MARRILSQTQFSIHTLIIKACVFTFLSLVMILTQTVDGPELMALLRQLVQTNITVVQLFKIFTATQTGRDLKNDGNDDFKGK